MWWQFLSFKLNLNTVCHKNYKALFRVQFGTTFWMSAALPFSLSLSLSSPDHSFCASYLHNLRKIAKVSSHSSDLHPSSLHSTVSTCLPNTILIKINVVVAAIAAITVLINMTTMRTTTNPRKRSVTTLMMLSKRTTMIVIPTTGGNNIN